MKKIRPRKRNTTRIKTAWHSGASLTKARRSVAAFRSSEATKKNSNKHAGVKKQKPERNSGAAQQDEALVADAEKMLKDEVFLDYIAKNVGSQANDVLKELSKGAKKDEQLAEGIGIKLNEVRRVLNLLNKHGIVRYDVKKDSSGWLTFEWHMDYVSFSDFHKELHAKAEAPPDALPENCNDFFTCGDCDKKQNIVYPFDIAYDKGFKCSCGKNLAMLSRSEAEDFVRN